MPFSSKFGFNNKDLPGSPQQVDPANIIITPSLLSNDTQILYTITSNRPNVTLNYRINGAVAEDFNSGTLTGNVSLDTNGNALLQYTANLNPLYANNIIKDNSSFNLQLYSTPESTTVISQSSNASFVANVHVTASGGTETTVSDANSSTGTFKIHTFTTNNVDVGGGKTVSETKTDYLDIFNAGTSPNSTNLSYLAVGGGGSGFSSTTTSHVEERAASGGGGGMVIMGNLTAGVNNVSVTVGNGGGANVNNNNPSDVLRLQNGETSSFTYANTTYTAFGGNTAIQTGNASASGTNDFGDFSGNSYFQNGAVNNGAEGFRDTTGSSSGGYEEGGGAGGAGGGVDGGAGGVPTQGPPGKGGDGGRGTYWFDATAYGGGGGGHAPVQPINQFPANVELYIGLGGLGGGGNGAMHNGGNVITANPAQPGQHGTGGGGGGGYLNQLIVTNARSSIPYGGDGTVKFRYEWDTPTRTMSLS